MKKASKQGKGTCERSDDEDNDQRGQDDEEEALQSVYETKISQTDRKKARRRKTEKRQKKGRGCLKCLLQLMTTIFPII